MKTHKSEGLLIGFLVALVAVGLAVVGAHPAPSAPAPAPTPATVVAALSPTAQPPTAPTSTPTPTAPPSATPTPCPTPSPTRRPSATPTPTPEADLGRTIGYSVQGRPIVAHRFGQGPVKVVLAADIHGEFESNTYRLAQELLAHFQAHPDEAPADVSLWIIPTMNPDGLATGHRWNANDVDLNRNADTDLDGCAGNDWSMDTVGLEGPHPGAGGPYPFSEPETRAVRDFLDDAWIAIFYHSAAEAIFRDTCQRHAPTARLAAALSAGSGYPVPEEGWTGYPITGDFSDYLAGEGVAAVTVELTDREDAEFERNLAGVRAVLAAVDGIVSAEAAAVGAGYIWLVPVGQIGNWPHVKQVANLPYQAVGVRRYADNSFVHPIALEVMDDTAYLLDGGRVLALDLGEPTPPRLLLAPGEYVPAGSAEGVRVLEPLDLAADAAPEGDTLLVLDRAGDVYRYDPQADAWSLERYDRPVRDTYDHYFVALAAGEAANYLLETTHEQVWRFPDGQKGVAWVKLPQSRDVDVSVGGQGVYVLTRAMNGPRANLLLYREARRVPAFQPNVDLMNPRQVAAAETAVYVLDRAGRRLSALDPAGGALRTLYQFTDRRAVSALWADTSGERLVLAGRDALYFVGEPEQAAEVAGGPTLEGPQPHDPALLAGLRGLQMPIEGARLTSRDFQLPGAPRHYRLGIHEGIDFYSHTVGVPAGRGAAVRAVADGVVIRALVDYQPLTAAQADAWYAKSHSLGYTPPEALDGYRGRQVWIDHGGSLVSRYAHLGSIEPGIVEGATVTQGQVIARVGNSGTPGSLRSRTYDAHLHLELWVNGHYVGQFLRPIEAREWLGRILR